jgi:hypothetical protein
MLIALLHDIFGSIDPTPNRTTIQTKLRADGREVFTPPLLAGRVYRLSFIGDYAYEDERGSLCSADVAYRSDGNRNLTIPYHSLFIDDLPADDAEIENWTENRATKEYSCLFEGSGREIPIRLHGPCRSDDWVVFRLELLPVDTPSVKVRVEQRRHQRQNQALRDQLRAERRKRQADLEAAEQAEAAWQETLRAAVRSQQHMVHANRNIFDPQFREAFVRQYQREILQTWRPTWTSEYTDVMGHSQLVAALKQEAPEVLRWHEERLEMILLAERLSVIHPQIPGNAVAAPIPISARTIAQVEGLINELFRFRQEYDTSEQREAREGKDWSAWRKTLLRMMGCNFEQLKRYGIYAQTAEDAEQKFLSLCPREPVKTVYEIQQEKIEEGQRVGVDILIERVKDLFREECILVVHRKNAIRSKRWSDQEEIDQRLAASRGEYAYWVDFLRLRGFPIELREREHEESLEEGIVRLCQAKIRVKKLLEQLGDPDGVDAVEALYAEETAKLFKPNSESYT